MRKNYIYIFSLFGILLMILIYLYLFFFEEQVVNYYQCKELNNFRLIELNCYVDQKYIDSMNHSYRTIEFKNCGKLILTHDTSLFYDFIEKGDNILKKYNSDSIVVFRDKSQNVFKITFPCN